MTSVDFNFDDPVALTKSLEGVSTLYNTYWIRFQSREMTFDKAIANSKTLIHAAEEAGVARIVHISITNPSLSSPLPYYHGKAVVEEVIQDSRLTYAILRPNVLFGDQGILINNIAWFLRHTPVFGVPGSGEYQMQPVFVEDLAHLAVTHGQTYDNLILDAVGPEIYTFNDLLRLIAATVTSSTRIIHLPAKIALLATWALGKALHDVIMTPDEAEGLQSNLLVSSNPPTCKARLSEWLEANSEWIGMKYFSEMQKHFR
jgi:uncharacterized protein YbjT (DUF2867 family)